MPDQKLTITTTVRDLASKALKSVGLSGNKAGQSIAAGFIKAQLAIGALRVALRSVTSLLRSVTTDAAKQGDAFQKMSLRLGVSVETLSEMDHVAQLAGTSIEDVGNALKLLAKNAYDASRDQGEAKDAFKELGIEVKDSNGTLKALDSLLLEVSDKFKELESDALKNAYAQRIFGRSGDRIKTILDQGSEAIARQREEARRLGSAWTTSQANLAAGFSDAQRRLNAAIEGLRNAVARELFPALKVITNKIANYLAENRGKIVQLARDAIYSVADFLTEAARALVYVAGELTDIVTKLKYLFRSPSSTGDKVAGYVFGSGGLAIKRLIEGSEEAGANSAERWVKAFDDGVAALKSKVQKTLEDVVSPENDPFANMTPTQLPEVLVKPDVSFWRGIVDGAKNATAALNEAAGSLEDFGRRLGESIIANAAQGFTNFFDSIVYGAESASEAFRNMARDIFRSISQIATNRIFLQLLNLIPGLGGGVGSNVGAVGPFPATAAGGIALGPQVRLVGEAGPEAIVPLSRADPFGGGVTINQTINAPSNVDYGALKQLSKAGLLEAIRQPSFRQAFRHGIRGLS